MADSVVIRGATWVESGVTGIETDVVVVDGRVAALGRGEGRGAGGRVVDGSGCVVAPGFLDLHCHLREPGQEHKETIHSGAMAAAAGGFTRVVAMANTTPPVDDIETLAVVMSRAAAAPVRVLPAAAVTVDLAGQQLTDIATLAAFGAVAFTDDGRHAYGVEVGEQALREAAAAGRAVMIHAQDESTCRDGQASPAVAGRAGLKPWPCSAEISAMEQMVEALRRAGGRLHVQHASCEAAVEVVRAARREGLPVTCEVTPHHLSLTDERVLRDNAADPDAKVNPPLRPEADRAALVRALQEGVIDAIATDHAPHEAASKDLPFERAAFGFSGLETALPVCLELVRSGALTMERLVHLLTEGPRRCLGGAIPGRLGLLRGEPADLVLFDPDERWLVEPAALRSMGKNTPLAGLTVRGRVVLTMAGGRLVHDSREVPVG